MERLTEKLSEVGSVLDSQGQMAHIRRDLRVLRLIAVFTCERWISHPKRHLDDVSLLTDAIRFWWPSWIVAASTDTEMGRAKTFFTGLQCWLFFGFITVVSRTLHIELAQEHLVDSTNRYTNTTWVSRYCELAQPQYENSTPEDRKRYESHLGQAKRRIQDFASTYPGSIMIESICSVFDLIGTTFIASYTTPQIHVPEYRSIRNALTERLVESGWCAKHVTQMQLDSSYDFQYFSYMLGPPISHSGHWACSEDICYRNTVEESDYRTRHVASCTEDDTKCMLLGPIQSKVLEVLNDRAIPVLLVSECQSSGQIELEIFKKRCRSCTTIVRRRGHII
ncbi:hypothetical protein BDV95DRAFT_594751 [Massariosphaeria phaeospora]|uniref:Heterokaryon incompatibility domain-containing protein n=1 Tax=Massariosphaeria phaeospora TaxID=100035 RepID=A0A7C8M9Z2_9PLEO|nr:hypothetical protein BDV95DRAFT_594751 [Massariosphaeria phaeospora]